VAYQGFLQHGKKRQSCEGQKGKGSSSSLQDKAVSRSEQSVVDCGNKLDTKGLVLGSIWEGGL
jgi:hypothetical protein